MPVDTGRVTHRDELHRGHAWKRPVHAATTADITIATALNDGDTIDGVDLVEGTRVLVKDQTAGEENGIYVVGATPARDFDMDADDEVLGAVVRVIGGTVNGGKLYGCTNTTGVVLGTTALVFEEIKAAGAALILAELDGGGTTITTGIKGDIGPVPFACVIEEATLLADQSGSIVVDIWKDTYANYPPVVGDSITASAKPTISTAVKSTDATLTGWTTAIAAGDVLRFNVDSVTTIERVTLALKVRKT